MHERDAGQHSDLIAAVRPPSLRREVAGHIEDHLSSLPERWCGIGDRQRASTAESHRDRVSSVIVEREVESRGGRVVHGDGTDEEIAEAGLLSHGKLARYRCGIRGHATLAPDHECSSDMRAEGTR